MRRRGASLALSLVAFAACVGGGSPAPDRTVAGSPTPSGESATPRVPGPGTPSSTLGPTATPSRPDVERLPAITLVGDLSEPPARWIPVVFVPFGDAADEAGALLKKRFASQPIVPPSFAVDRDGSVWLLDLVKHRIAHYDPTGRFLGAIGGLEFSRFRPYAQDLAFVGGRLYVSEFTHVTLQTYVRSVTPDGLGRRVRVEAHGRPLMLLRLVSPSAELTGFSSGSAGTNGAPPTGGGIIGYRAVDPMTGASLGVPGIAMDDGSTLATGPRLIHDGREVAVVHHAAGVRERRLLRLVVRPTAADDVHIPVVAGWETYVALPNGFATYMGFSPARAADQERHRGSDRWLLEYFDDGTPLVWEPLPRSPLTGANVWRYLAEGLDGRLYLMLAERGGMRIYRRPGPAST